MKETVYSRVLYAILRHLISGISGVLVAHGWIEAELANNFNDSAAMQITLGIISFLTAIYFSYKDKILEFVKTHIARVLPPTTPMETVNKIARTVEKKKEVAKGDLSSLNLPEVIGNA